jgi:hypothetical protein
VIAHPLSPVLDPDTCNLYKNLEFPESMYQDITDDHQQKASDETPAPSAVT